MFAFRIRVFCFIIRFIRHSVRWLVTSIISRKTRLRSSSWMVAWTKVWQRMFEEHQLPRTFEEHLLNVRLNVTVNFKRYNDFECCHLNVLQCSLVQSLEACGMTLHISDMFHIFYHGVFPPIVVKQCLHFALWFRGICL